MIMTCKNNSPRLKKKISSKCSEYPYMSTLHRVMLSKIKIGNKFQAGS